MNGPSFAQRAFIASRDSVRGHVPVSRQMDDVERLYMIAYSMAGSEQELLSLTHRLAVYADMDLGYHGDVMSWQKEFDKDTLGYAFEYKGILESMIDDDVPGAGTDSIST